MLRPELSWTHYRLLLGVTDSAARECYMNEAASEHCSTRQLERQISVLYYERLQASHSVDLLAYRQEQERIRQQALDELTRQADENDMGY